MQIAGEAKQLDRLGLQVPQVALNVALQQPRHRQAVEGLAAMLDAYRKVSPSELSGCLTPRWGCCDREVAIGVDGTTDTRINR